MQVLDPSRTNLDACKMPPVALVVDPPTAETGEAEVAERAAVGPQTGFPMLAQSLLHCPPGRIARRSTGTAEEVLFVLAGRGRLRVTDGAGDGLEAESGAYLPPGEEYEIEAIGEEAMRIVRVAIFDPAQPEPPGARPTVRRIDDQQAQSATTDREFRIVADPATGLCSATQFVGYVPAARAPDHFHTYDEVIYIIDGEGELDVGGVKRPLRSGSSIQLPAGTVHCLSNTGREVMRLVAVFRPAGSPAAAYYPDGTPAYRIPQHQGPPKEEGNP